MTNFNFTDMVEKPQLSTEQQKLLQALMEKPTRYTIDVLDDSMLPEKMKDRKEIDFVFKPPTMDTLLRAADQMQFIPTEILEYKGMPSLKDVAPHAHVLVRTLCILSWAKKTPYPDWYEPFLLANATAVDIYKMFVESTMKMRTDFFLSSFLLANQNPMMLHKNERQMDGSTRTK